MIESVSELFDRIQRDGELLSIDELKKKSVYSIRKYISDETNGQPRTVDVSVVPNTGIRLYKAITDKL